MKFNDHGWKTCLSINLTSLSPPAMKTGKATQNINNKVVWGY